MQKGILLVSFGTTFPETREKNIHALTKRVQSLYPDRMVGEAFTSAMVRGIISKKEGKTFPSVAQALEAWAKQGVEEVCLLPTHIIDGIECAKMRREALESSGLFRSIRIGQSLLGSGYYLPAAEAILREAGREAGEGLFFMGHGSHHPADRAYGEMEQALRSLAGEHCFVSTLEGERQLEDVLPLLPPPQVCPRFLLLPLMLVAGDHVHNDMLENSDSYARQLEAAGYAVRGLAKGLGEYAGIQELYLRRLEEALAGEAVA